MVFHLADDNIIASPDVSPAPTIGHQIDAFGGTAHEHQLFQRTGIKESGRLLAYLLHPRRRFGAQGMDTTMDGSVTVAIKLGFGINHRFRFLRAGGAIEINQRLTINLAAQHREIGAQAFH